MQITTTRFSLASLSGFFFPRGNWHSLKHPVFLDISKPLATRNLFFCCLPEIWVWFSRVETKAYCTLSGGGNWSWLTSRGVIRGMVSNPSSRRGCFVLFSLKLFPSFTILPGKQDFLQADTHTHNTQKRKPERFVTKSGCTRPFHSPPENPKNVKFKRNIYIYLRVEPRLEQIRRFVK